jgi:hypothetical protein
MSNGYFTFSSTNLADGRIAYAATWRIVFDAIEDAFDLLPTEDQIKLGLTQYGTDSGASNAYVVTMPHTPDSYTDGMVVTFKASNSNSGASTVNVDSLGAKTITRQSGAALQSGDIVADKFTTIVYNSTSGNFEILSNTADAALQTVVAAIAAIAAGSGVVISANDTTPGVHEDKVVSTDGSVAFSTNNEGANETRDLSVATYVGTQVATKIANVVEDTTPQLGGELDCQEHSVGFTLQEESGTGTINLDLRKGNKILFTFGNGNAAFTFTDPTKPCTITLWIKQYSTGGQVITSWPGNVRAPHGVPIVLSTGNNAIDKVLLTYDGTYYDMDYGAGNYTLIS